MADEGRLARSIRADDGKELATFYRQVNAAQGCNLPAALCALIMGESPPILQPPQAGTLFIRSAEEIIVSLASFEAVMLTGHTSATGGAAKP